MPAFGECGIPAGFQPLPGDVLGLPVGAFGGRADVMERVAPLGPVYQAGTLSGNPLAVAAGLETLKLLRETNPYEQLEKRAARLEAGLKSAAEDAGVASTVNRAGSMLTAFFRDGDIRNWDDAKTSDTGKYASYFRSMLDSGIYLAPSQFECAFVSAAHDDEMIEKTISAARLALRA